MTTPDPLSIRRLYGRSKGHKLRDGQAALVEELLPQGKATVAGVRKAAEDGQDLATKAVLAGRKEAAKQVEAVADSAQSAAGKFGAEAGKLGKRTIGVSTTDLTERLASVGQHR